LQKGNVVENGDFHLAAEISDFSGVEIVIESANDISLTGNRRPEYRRVCGISDRKIPSRVDGNHGAANLEELNILVNLFLREAIDSLDSRVPKDSCEVDKNIRTRKNNVSACNELKKKSAGRTGGFLVGPNKNVNVRENSHRIER
jgi:hypothetical protein